MNNSVTPAANNSSTAAVDLRCNTGNWNTGDCNTGCFCVGTPNMSVFDADSGLTREEFWQCYSLTIWPQIVKDGKVVAYRDAWRAAWNSATDEQREGYRRLCADYAHADSYAKFLSITGIDLREPDVAPEVSAAIALLTERGLLVDGKVLV